MNQINNLIALKSVFELKMGHKSLGHFIKNISDETFAKKIINEIKRRNFGNITLMIDHYIYENNQNSILYDVTDIKQFDFVLVENTTIDDIKALLEINQLNLNILKDPAGNDTSSYCYWNNDNRVAVVLSIELAKSIKENNELKLILFKKFNKSKLGYYTHFSIEKQEVKDSNKNELKISKDSQYQVNKDSNNIFIEDNDNYDDQKIINIFDEE